MTDAETLTPEQMRVDGFDEEDEALMQTFFDQVRARAGPVVATVHRLLDNCGT